MQSRLLLFYEIFTEYSVISVFFSDYKFWYPTQLHGLFENSEIISLDVVRYDFGHIKCFLKCRLLYINHF